MEYTVQKLGQMAGISARTLRYYDEIGILKPARINSSGYRIYGSAEVDILQQILFYRELGVSLDRIKEIIGSPSFNETQALREHREKLLAKKNQLEALISNVERTIAMKEGRLRIMDQDKFEGFKQKLIEENEQKYGSETRAKYGDETVDQSHQKMMKMSEQEFEEVTKLEKQLLETLQAALKSGDPAGELAQQAADLHRRWLCFYWPQYSKEAHAGVAQMYVDDPRFTAYYDKQQPGTTEFLRDAVFIYTGMKQ